MKIWLVGASAMAVDYFRVLESLEIEFDVIGRGSVSALAFEKETNRKVLTRGLERQLQEEETPDVAIIAVGIGELASVAETLIRAGTKRILLEKPGGLDLAEISKLDLLARKKDAKVLIAYNRRFLASIIKLRELISKGDEVRSIRFEFTERSHIIEKLAKNKGIKERWLLGNSSHVIDLAFHLAGKPDHWNLWHNGSLDWHPASSQFAGAGLTDRGIIFSYFADWQGPGSWEIELITKSCRYFLNPLETLRLVRLGVNNVEEIPINDTFDKNFKPGLFEQTKAFLKGDDKLFCSLTEQVSNVEIYSKMAGYL